MQRSKIPVYEGFERTAIGYLAALELDTMPQLLFNIRTICIKVFAATKINVVLSLEQLEGPVEVGRCLGQVELNGCFCQDGMSSAVNGTEVE